MGYFSSKVAVVTGGASGIGRALCGALARREAIVIVADIDAEGAERAAGQITELGGRAFASAVDVRDADSVAALVDGVVAQHGRLDVMVNNAGVALDGELQETTVQERQAAVDVNVHGVLNGSAAAYRAMLGQGGGHIINMASLSGLLPVPGMPVYAATKHAVVGFSTSLRGEARRHGVAVSVVCPGFVQPMATDAAGLSEAERAASRPSTWPVRRIDSATCARAILRGAARKKAVIVMPPYAGFAARLYGLLPGVYNRLVVPAIARRMRGRSRAG